MLAQLSKALSRFAHAPVQTGFRIKMPECVPVVARRPLSWIAPPTDQRIEFVSIAIANWLRGRAPIPDASVLDDASFVATNETTFLYDARFRALLSDHVSNERRPRALLRLIDAFFQSELEHGALLGPLIAPNVSRHGETAELVEPMRLGLFDGSALVESVVAQVIQLDGDVGAALQRFGAEMAAARCRLCQRVLEVVPNVIVEELIHGRLEETAVLSKTLDSLSRMEVHTSNDTTTSLVEKILRIADGNRIEQQSRVAAACAILGDPVANAGAWEGIEKEQQRAVVTWMPRRTIDLAFRLTGDLDELSRWKAEYWLGLADQGVIEQATLVAAGSLMERLRSDPATVDFAKFAATAKHNTYANVVLIMRAGAATIAEWAPSGSCRVWLEGNSAAPKLQSAEYDLWQIRAGADYEQVHRGSQKGLWQSELTTWLENAGINILNHERLL